MPNHSTKTGRPSTKPPEIWRVRTIEPDEVKDMARQFENWLFRETSENKVNRNAINVPLIYIDIACDLAAGIILSQIMYWYGKDKKGIQRVSNPEKGLAKSRTDWYKETRLTEYEVDRAIKKLTNSHVLPSLNHDGVKVWREPLVEVSYHRFNGLRTMHLKPIMPNILATWECVGKLLPESDASTYKAAKLFDRS